MFSLIVCTDGMMGIGNFDGSIPFRNSGDLANFKKKTLNNIVIMGRKTWDSIPKKPLQQRLNIIISASMKSAPDGVLLFSSIEKCLIELSKKEYRPMEKFVIGGATLYNYFINNNLVQKIYHTVVLKDYHCDIKMNKYDGMRYKKKPVLSPPDFNDECWMYRELEYINHEEIAFLNLLSEILNNGSDRKDRTMIGTRSVFGKFLEFDLSNNTFPLGTTKRVPFRQVFEELMWFLRGQTDADILEKKDIHIWKGNTTRDFLDARGLNNYKEGDIGPTYGFSFRYYGADYIGCDSNYEGQGFDQLSEAIRLIKEDPYSRRIIINLWNPKEQNKMALPPCLFIYQFYVDGNELSCLMTQRSSDISLAGFWNIATGSLLTYMIARMTGLKPKRLKWSIGDAHIYNNQINAVVEQLQRKPRIFPKLFFKSNSPSLENGGQITEFEYSDLELVAYEPHAPIKSVMNV